jgi:hypothetical protein
MPTPQEKLAHSLEALHELQKRGVAIRSDDLSRTRLTREAPAHSSKTPCANHLPVWLSAKRTAAFW